MLKSRLAEITWAHVAKVYSYGSGKNKAGLVLTENNTSGSPTYVSYTNNGIHTWKCNYETNGPKCGYHCCYYHYVDNCSGNEKEGESCPQKLECADDTCPNTCAWGDCKHSNDYIPPSCTAAAATSSASVSVPYNFSTAATISLASSYVYAGETAAIASSYAQVLPRSNSTLKGTYATQVDDAKVKFASYLSNGAGGSPVTGGSGKDQNICTLIDKSNCVELDSADNLTLNSAGYLQGSSYDSLTSIMETNYNVYDAQAGQYYCVVAAVYPYTVSSDLDMSTSGSNSWYVSSPSCAVIAKKPSIQVWGSGISTAISEKRSVSGFVNYSPRGSNDTTVFGSWVEESIVANGIVNGLASGASTGYPGNTARTISGLGGSKEGSVRSFCATRSPLTMPNASCMDGSGLPGINLSGGISSTTAKMNRPDDHEDIIARFMENDGTFQYITAYTKLSQFTTGVIGSTTIPAGQRNTYVIDAKGKTFTIDTDIQYADTYTYFVDIPKLIIRADNINIKCNVNRVDAVLIADKTDGSGVLTGKVDTCSDGGSDNNAAKKSRQLKINGVVIAGYLEAGRTYGASYGAYSSIPAEIIDYDVSLYLWGSPKADASSSGKLDMVYVHELSPRL